MNVKEISEDVRDFILEHINSVEELEVLLLMRRTRARTWTAAELAEELRSSELSTRTRLRDLQKHQLVAEVGPGPGFVYAADAPGLDTLVGKVEAAYATYRFTVIDLIFSKPGENVRSFVRAFRFRKDDDDA